MFQRACEDAYNMNRLAEFLQEYSDKMSAVTQHGNLSSIFSIGIFIDQNDNSTVNAHSALSKGAIGSQDRRYQMDQVERAYDFAVLHNTPLPFRPPKGRDFKSPGFRHWFMNMPQNTIIMRSANALPDLDKTITDAFVSVVVPRVKPTQATRVKMATSHLAIRAGQLTQEERNAGLFHPAAFNKAKTSTQALQMLISHISTTSRPRPLSFDNLLRFTECRTCGQTPVTDRNTRHWCGVKRIEDRVGRGSEVTRLSANLKTVLLPHELVMDHIHGRVLGLQSLSFEAQRAKLATIGIAHASANEFLPDHIVLPPLDPDQEETFESSCVYWGLNSNLTAPGLLRLQQTQALVSYITAHHTPTRIDSICLDVDDVHRELPKIINTLISWVSVPPSERHQLDTLWEIRCTSCRYAAITIRTYGKRAKRSHKILHLTTIPQWQESDEVIESELDLDRAVEEARANQPPLDLHGDPVIEWHRQVHNFWELPLIIKCLIVWCSYFQNAHHYEFLSNHLPDILGATSP